VIRHLVMFRWKEGTTADDLAAIAAGLDLMPAAVPSIRGYTHGPSLRVADGEWDYAIVADFDDVAGWKAYDDHPEHDRVRGQIIRPHIADRAAVRFAL
jgi:hypothetical protein